MTSRYSQPELGIHMEESKARFRTNNNAMMAEDRAFHDWYRFVLSFPPHLVREYLGDLVGNENRVVLDPFCGTGTTLVESMLQGVRAIGLEANPFSHFASSVKICWSIDPEEFLVAANQIAESTYQILENQGIDDRMLSSNSSIQLRKLDPGSERALIKDSISPIPLHKSLVLLECLRKHIDKPYYDHGLLALGSALVSSIGNLRFGPEVGIGKKKHDANVVSAWLSGVGRMVKDLRAVKDDSFPKSDVKLADARQISSILQSNSVDLVITSPPYPNEKDYTRTSRLESVVLGFFEDIAHIRGYKKTLLRSNTRGVYKADDDDKWVENNAEIQRIADEIERRRIELGKTSGFEKLYARVTRLYFGGMARHFSDLRTVLKPGARLAYVVGDQASYLRVMIRTGQLLAEIAEELGYEVERIDLFRERFSTATKSSLREEVLVLHWPG